MSYDQYLIGKLRYLENENHDLKGKIKELEYQVEALKVEYNSVKQGLEEAEDDKELWDLHLYHRNY